jgi:transposase-like protein
VVSIATKIGCTPQTLNEWVKKADVDSGREPGLTAKPQRCARTWNLQAKSSTSGTAVSQPGANCSSSSW